MAVAIETWPPARPPARSRTSSIVGVVASSTSLFRVLLQRLMRRGGSLSQHRMGLLGNVLDLHTGHGANMALEAPIRNRLVNFAVLPRSLHRRDRTPRLPTLRR